MRFYLSLLMCILLFICTGPIFSDSTFSTYNYGAKNSNIGSAPSKPPTLDEIQSQKNIMDTYNFLMKYRNIRFNDCLKSIGHEKFCRCISENLSWAISFINYIAITQSDIVTLDQQIEKNHDNTMRILVDRARKAREKCVLLFNTN